MAIIPSKKVEWLKFLNELMLTCARKVKGVFCQFDRINGYVINMSINERFAVTESYPPCQ